MNVWEEFPEEARMRAVEVANHVISQVRLVPWTPEQMETLWRRRSYDQICSSGEVNVCVPCIDTAALAVAYLETRRESSFVTLFTEQGAAEDFVAAKKRKLHLDATASFLVDGIPYEVDIGAGDITLLKGRPRHKDDILFATTRHDEPEWRRTGIASLSGAELMRNKETPLVELLLQQRTTPLPFGLTREDFYRVNLEEGANDRDEFYTHAGGYDGAIERARSEGWTESVQHVFPGLKPFNYAD
ncbi:MAG: hypothetical protein ABIH92_03250 [Nanoarchaeota archaeon]